MEGERDENTGEVLVSDGYGKRILSLYLSGENLTDRAYQSHLSRLKYLDRNVATGKTGVYNMGRNFSVKMVVPILLRRKFLD